MCWALIEGGAKPAVVVHCTTGSSPVFPLPGSHHSEEPSRSLLEFVLWQRQFLQSPSAFPTTEVTRP